MEEISFKERVRKAAIDGAQLYKKIFVDCEYLICSKAFNEKQYYVAKADNSNYLHLIGEHTELTPEEFFKKCYEGTLTGENFDFDKKNQSEKSVKGSVRQKIKVLPDMLQMYGKELVAQEKFKKNRVECAFATADSTHTLGYASVGRPKSLLQKNELDQDKSEKVDLVFQKNRGADKYRKLIVGDEAMVDVYRDQIKMMLDDSFDKNKLL